MREFVHHCLGEEIAAIGGRYVFVEEVRLPWGCGEVLYYVGYAVVDSSCCGSGGTAFAVVEGLIRQWHCARTPEGREISRVEPIEKAEAQAELRRLIKARELVLQVNFLS
jgi:hypothetical protein